MRPVEREIRRLTPEYINLLKRLVGYESIYGNEKNHQLFLESKLHDLGLEVGNFLSRKDEQSLNLVGVREGTRKDKYNSLVLNAHGDISPVDGLKRWDHDPFKAEINEGRLFARGAQDDKAGIVIVLMLLNLLNNLKIKLKGNLIVQFVIEEETTGNGSKILVDNGFIGDGVVIVDGTFSGEILYKFSGQVSLGVMIRGEPVPAHIADTVLNPVYVGNEFIQKLKNFLNKIDEDITLNIGSICAGVWFGSVPAEVKMKIQITFPDKHSGAEIISYVREAAEKVSDQITIKEGLLKTPPCETDRDNLLIRRLKSIIEKNSGGSVEVNACTGYCDMRHFPTENICLYGPGKGGNAHSINEYYCLEELPEVTLNLFDFIVDWCNLKK